jgi:hypothetical protein
MVRAFKDISHHLDLLGAFEDIILADAYDISPEGTRRIWLPGVTQCSSQVWGDIDSFFMAENIIELRRRFSAI